MALSLLRVVWDVVVAVYGLPCVVWCMLCYILCLPYDACGSLFGWCSALVASRCVICVMVCMLCDGWCVRFVVL